MSNAENQCAPGQLWYPGLHLDEEFPVPTDAELEAMWDRYTDIPGSRALTSVYGVFTPPEREIKAVASIDLCEVVRDTAVGLDHALNPANPHRRGVYKANFWERMQADEDYQQSVIVSTARALIHNGHVMPVPEIGEIRSQLQEWRSLGVFCVANTSTLPGCEAGTITHTFGRDLPGGFDGLVLPRNHDGKGPTSKARALQLVAEQTGLDIEALPVVHIDDTIHHIDGFQKVFASHPRARFFVPLHVDNHHAAPELLAESPHAAFVAANAFFRESGVVA